MLATAALVIISLARGLILYGGDVNGIKVGILCVLFVWWLMFFPLAGEPDPMPRNQNGYRQVLNSYQEFGSTYVFPIIVMVVFVWMTFTSWKGEPSEIRLKELPQGQDSKESK